MMTGRVTALREATIRLTVAGPYQHQQVIETVLDTGFTGFLTLPSHVVHTLQLPFVGHRRATLGDGSTVVLDLYLATVFWHEQERAILVLQAEGGPLMGMALLDGNRVILHIDALFVLLPNATHQARQTAG
jgi:clan AA aspartic protease